jgi:hypothetical protein
MESITLNDRRSKHEIGWFTIRNPLDYLTISGIVTWLCGTYLISKPLPPPPAQADRTPARFFLRLELCMPNCRTRHDSATLGKRQ